MKEKTAERLGKEKTDYSSMLMAEIALSEAQQYNYTCTIKCTCTGQAIQSFMRCRYQKQTEEINRSHSATAMHAVIKSTHNETRADQHLQ